VRVTSGRAAFGTGRRGEAREAVGAEGVRAGQEGGGPAEDVEADGAAEVGIGWREEQGGGVSHGERMGRRHENGAPRGWGTSL